MFPSEVNSAQSLSFSFTKFGPDQKDLIFQGYATSTNNVLQLTKLDNRGNPMTAESNKVVVVKFDTYTYPNANVDDPTYRHIGIDVNSIRSKATARWEWQNGKTAKARISYDFASKKLTVATFYPGIEVVTLSHDIDLHTSLPEWVRVGLSASTGEEKQRNTILSWSFTSSLKNKEVREVKEDLYIASVV
ncbi:hypothetical protein VNO80_16620 [Phaseolus coccineus]|uniref:Legume lectin domain-containing protein n=1 Tax=Phaseolus coccineus TaxID=3886 RepID=A0AAN9R3E0_PHACN